MSCLSSKIAIVMPTYSHTDVINVIISPTSCIITERVLEPSYHGLIKENETYVEITPLIKVDGNVVCGFHILKKNKEIPFQVSEQPETLLDMTSAYIVLFQNVIYRNIKQEQKDWVVNWGCMCVCLCEGEITWWMLLNQNIYSNISFDNDKREYVGVVSFRSCSITISPLKRCDMNNFETGKRPAARVD